MLLCDRISRRSPLFARSFNACNRATLSLLCGLTRVLPSLAYRFLFLLFLLVLSGISVQGQTASPDATEPTDDVPAPTLADSTEERSNSLYALPVVFYTPETSLGFGVAGVYAFNFKDDLLTARPSSVQVVAAYTLQKQLLLYFPFTLFVDNGDYYTYGEIGYYRYVYKFFGIGNEVDPNVEETYGVNFPRIRLTALKRVHPKWYVGLRYWFEKFNITETDNEGMLAAGDITGSRGGVTSGPGLVALFDTRDNVFFSSDGWYVETLLQRNAGWTGSDFNYTTFSVDASTFFRTRWDHIVALNAYGITQSGASPFNQMALLGGSKRMRGYFEGRYRDQSMLTIQAAYRAILFWRIGAVAFASYGGVAPGLSDIQLEDFRYTVGGGLRFVLDREKKINIRLDAGFGKNTSGYYLTIGEAF